MGKHKLDRLFNHIEDLTAKQSQFEQDSVDWMSLESQIVFAECMIFNKLLKTENIDINDFSLTLDQMNTIDKLNKDLSFGFISNKQKK